MSGEAEVWLELPWSLCPCTVLLSVAVLDALMGSD